MGKYSLRRNGGRILVCLGILILAVILLPGCGAFDKREACYPVTRVSVILPHNDDGYWSLIQEGIEEAQAELGNQYGIDIQIHIPQLNYNISQMTDILKQQVAAQVDIIAVQGNEDAQFRRVLEDARRQGIQVICVDTEIEDFPYDLYIGTDNYAAGKLMGKNLAELTGGKAKVAVISGEEGYSNLEQRLTGLCEELSKYPGIEVTGVSYNHYDGLTFMELYHRLGGEADVLACIEGTGGQTLSHTFAGKDPAYSCVVGFDAYTGVKSQVLAGVVKQDTNQMGRRLVEEIANYVVKGSYSSNRIYTDTCWLTAGNYDEVMR